jgi:hypothetical protein
VITTLVVVGGILYALGAFIAFVQAAADYSLEGQSIFKPDQEARSAAARRMFMSPLWPVSAFVWLRKAWDDANPVQDEEVEPYGTHE